MPICDRIIFMGGSYCTAHNEFVRVLRRKRICPCSNAYRKNDMLFEEKSPSDVAPAYRTEEDATSPFFDVPEEETEEKAGDEEYSKNRDGDEDYTSEHY